MATKVGINGNRPMRLKAKSKGLRAKSRGSVRRQIFIRINQWLNLNCDSASPATNGKSFGASYDLRENLNLVDSKP